MRKFKVEKLIRDRILKNIFESSKTNTVDYKILSDESFLKALKKKFYEEIKELDFNEDKKDIVKELADLQLIINSCLKILKIDKGQFKKIGDEKIKKLGKFDKKIYVKTVNLDDDDAWIDYYKKKYKEIK